jgi:hypothetical protein
MRMAKALYAPTEPEAHPKVRIGELGTGVSGEEVDARDLAPLVHVHNDGAEFAEVLVHQVQPVWALRRSAEIVVGLIHTTKYAAIGLPSRWASYAIGPSRRTSRYDLP